jgi:hypothetical protein
MATVAVFLALGGGAYALNLGRNSVGAKQIRTNAVRAAEIQAGQVGAAEIGDGQVGAAEIGDGQVGSAEIGAGQVQPGDVAAALGLSCPGATLYHEGACIETAARAISGDFGTALTDCKDEGRRLPTAAELQGFRLREGITLQGAEWSSTRTVSPDATGTLRILTVEDDGDEPADFLSSTLLYRCVALASG